MKRKTNGMRASEWTPPTRMLDIAKERTLDIIGVWCARFRWGNSSITQLAESCYMQGINDASEALLVHAEYTKGGRTEGEYEEIR